MSAHIDVLEGGERSFLFLHGILGTGANWRSIARATQKKVPEILPSLVTLRGHGNAEDGAAPHTIQAAASDLPAGAYGILGHSFGGKVAIQYAAQSMNASPVQQLWIIDSVPSPRPERKGSESVLKVIDTLRTLPRFFPDRRAFMDAVVATGLSKPLAQWLSMNTRSSDEGVFFRPKLEQIDQLLADYFEVDGYGLLETVSAEVHIVIGGDSEVFTESERERARAFAADRSNVFVHVIEGAGHWVHSEKPRDLIALLSERLS